MARKGEDILNQHRLPARLRRAADAASDGDVDAGTNSPPRMK
jgi:hypothetical protein